MYLDASKHLLSYTTRRCTELGVPNFRCLCLLYSLHSTTEFTSCGLIETPRTNRMCKEAPAMEKPPFLSVLAQISNYTDPIQRSKQWTTYLFKPGIQIFRRKRTRIYSIQMAAL
jgi:hypothetical protein